MRGATFFVLACAVICAQPAGRVIDVEGKAVDSLTSLPVPGARVILVRVDNGTRTFSPDIWKTAPSAGEQDAKADQLAVLTGDDGVFRFRVEGPVKFRLFTRRAGYVDNQELDKGGTIYEAKPGAPKNDIVIRMQAEGGISGSVIDAGTREPVRGLAVMPYQYQNFGGGRMLAPTANSGTTDEEGRYKVERLAPGEYYIEVRPPLGAKLGEPKPVEDFRHDVRRTYARTWYPGVARVEEATPVTLPEGGMLPGIDFKIEKKRTAAIRGRVVGQEDATKTDQVLLSLTSVTRQMGAERFMTIAQGMVKPGTEFEIDRLAPGTYYLMAHTPGRARSERQAAVLMLRVEEENLDALDLHLSLGLSVTGRVRMVGREEKPDQPSLPSAVVQVHLSPLVRAPFVDELPVTVRAKDGTFTIEGIIPDRYRVAIVNAPKGYKLSEALYNGVPCPHGTMSPEPGALAHSLELTLAPANGSVSITATDGSRAAAGATVVLAPEPVDQTTPDHAFRWAKTDGEGKATLGELLPGAYRMVAFPDGALWMNDPNLKQRLAGGQEVRVGQNSIGLIQVRTQE